MRRSFSKSLSRLCEWLTLSGGLVIDLGLRRKLPTLAALAMSLLRTVAGKGATRASFWMTYRRLRSCQRCQIFNAKKWQCGTPNKTWIGPWRLSVVAVTKTEYLVLKAERRREQFGCLCWMRWAAGILGKDCWAWLQIGADGTDGIGWPIGLNGSILLNTWKRKYRSTYYPQGKLKT